LGEFIAKIGRLKLPLADTFDYLVAEKTIAALNGTADRPFMVTCSFNWPHDPNVVPSPYYEMFDPHEIELPSNHAAIEESYAQQLSRRIVADLGEASVREFMRVYFGMVKLVDDQVGRVLEALAQTGRDEDTIVVFTADHGDMCGSHGMVWKSNDSFYDEVVRVPLLVRYPCRIAPGRLDIACSLVDLMPTLLDLTGQPIPDRVQGGSIAPFLLGERPVVEAPPYAFCERLTPHPEHRRIVETISSGKFMVRSKDWKYCRYPDQAFLYHLADDPGETRNLVSDPGCQARKCELETALDAWLSATGSEATLASGRSS
jgi:arylsulfatase A-like enzyme